MASDVNDQIGVDFQSGEAMTSDVDDQIGVDDQYARHYIRNV